MTALYTLDGPEQDFLITDDTPIDVTNDPLVDGEHKARGLIPRPLHQYPPGSYPNGTPAQAVQFPLIPADEVNNRILLKEQLKSRLSDVRNIGNNGKPIPSLDQNGKGYCWIHSCASAVMLLRAAQGDPYIGLSAYAGACIIKNYRDEGGWGAQGMDFVCQHGLPSEQYWPMKSMDRANDNPQTWANAALHKVTAGFWDLAVPQYNRNLSFSQVITCLLLNIPVVCDYNWWGHSVCGMDAVNGVSRLKQTRCGLSGKLLDLATFERVWAINDPVVRGIAVRILNSWTDGWGQNGTSVLAGQRAVPDGSVAPRTTIPGPS